MSETPCDRCDRGAGCKGRRRPYISYDPRGRGRSLPLFPKLASHFQAKPVSQYPPPPRVTSLGPKGKLTTHVKNSGAFVMLVDFQKPVSHCEGKKNTTHNPVTHPGREIGQRHSACMEGALDINHLLVLKFLLKKGWSLRKRSLPSASCTAQQVHLCMASQPPSTYASHAAHPQNVHHHGLSLGDAAWGACSDHLPPATCEERRLRASGSLRCVPPVASQALNTALLPKGGTSPWIHRHIKWC